MEKQLNKNGLKTDLDGLKTDLDNLKDIENGVETPQKPIDQYGNNLAIDGKLDNRISKTGEAVKRDQEEIKKLYESMGLSIDPNLETASGSYLSTLQEQKEGAKEKIKDEEDSFLGAPRRENSEKIENPTKQTGKAQEDRVKELKETMEEDRKKFVDEFIKSSIQKMGEHFKAFLSDSKNADKAEQLMQKKIEITVLNKAEDFIKNGKDLNLSFIVEMNSSEFSEKNGEKNKYITDINIKFDDEEIPVAIDDETNNKEEKDLIDSRAKEGIKDAEKQGILKEKKEGTDN